MTPAGPAKRHWVRAWLFTVKSITTALTVAVQTAESTALPGERQRALTADWLLGEALCEVKGHDGCGRAQGPAGVLPQRVRLCLARLAEVQRALVGTGWRNMNKNIWCKKWKISGWKMIFRIEELWGYLMLEAAEKLLYKKGHLDHVVHGCDVKALTCSTRCSYPPQVLTNESRVLDLRQYVTVVHGWKYL